MWPEPMRVHHLNAVSMCPVGGALVDGHSISLRGRLACHCLLVETREGLVLVDTGLGLRDVTEPRRRLSRLFLSLLAPELREQMTAVRQIERLGFEAEDVRHLVLTHLDFDHAGGLDDFPDATVHLLADERDAAVARRTLLDKMRYRPQQWGSRARWQTYARGEGEAWFGFDAVRDLDGLPAEILLVPLVGHTLGHAGVAVRGEHGWILQAGDAYFYHAEMDPEIPRCTPGLRLYQTLMEKDRKARLWNRDRLRLLAMDHGGEVTVTCSHDPVEFERLAGRSLVTPTPPRYLHPVERPFQGAARP
jgi:glyoxylase-like metal-dependent hydrolase (beta-lactamase superfamily II)